MPKHEYILGTSDYELDRLRVQHKVWGPVTAELFDRSGLATGMRCLDVGCGPGACVDLLRAAVGPDGSVVGLDASEKWVSHVEALVEERGWKNVEARRASVQEAELEPASYDFIFMRWVLSFLPDPEPVLRKLGEALVPGGVLVIQDYNHEGISVFPESEGFRAVIRACRETFRETGGDLWIAGRLPRMLATAGLETVVFEPRLLAGASDSAVADWMDAFFTHHAVGFRERGMLTEDEHTRFEAEWAERRADPHATFFSPIVVGVTAQKPSTREP